MRAAIALLAGLLGGAIAFLVIYLVPPIKRGVRTLAEDNSMELWMVALACALALGGAAMGVAMKLMKGQR